MLPHRLRAQRGASSNGRKQQRGAPPRAAAGPAPPALQRPAFLLLFLLLLLLLLLLLALFLRHRPAATAPPRGVPPPAPAGHLCAPTDWATAPAVAPPEVWLQSRVYNGEALLDFSLALPPKAASFVTQLMAASGMWAPVETRIFLAVLTSPKVRHFAPLVVDVGANLGYFSQLALSLGYEVLAVEPQARAQPYLAATTARNGNGARLTLFACALGGVRGVAAMGDTARWEVPRVEHMVPLEAPAVADAGGGGGGEATNATVPMVLLSDLVPPGAAIALLKVDTEGWERGVFAGAPPELLARVRNVVVEIKTSEARTTLQALLGAAGFTCVQYQEQYAEMTPGVAFMDLEGKWLDTRLPRKALLEAVSSHLIRPCRVEDPEDYWFSREDFPWNCDSVGC
jgi:FkbM family methyltransferase